MNKTQLLLWGGTGAAVGDFLATVHGRLAPRLLDTDAARVKLSVTEHRPPALRVVPIRNQAFGLFSLWHESEALPGLPGILADSGLDWATYRVQESTPCAYERDWPDGQRSPGVVLLTLFMARRGLSRERFVDIWHGEHTPMAMRIHPLWNYVRNVVDDRDPDAAPAFSGIVEEHFRKREDVTDPRRFFGGDGQVVRNMLRVGLHTRSFIDLAKVQNYLVSEYHLRS